MTLAMSCSAAVAAAFVGGKATRDALFLTSLGVSALPTILIATSACSLALVVAQGRWGRLIPPRILVPAAFAVSGALFLGEWLVRSVAPSLTAVAIFLHVSGAGPLLASGFWLIASERFDPRAAKKGFGRITAAGTLGGLVGALIAERVATWLGMPAMLLVLAGFQVVTAWLVWRLVSGDRRFQSAQAAIAQADTMPTGPGLRVVANSPPLCCLAALVLLGTTGAALLEYLFKAQAVVALGGGDRLLRFFAVYYAATSLVTFVLQATSSRAALERFGVALSASTPSIALLAGSLGSLVAPGFGSLMVARSGESIFRGSWFRAGYELFYTPMPAAEKRAAKPVIDVAFDRLGDAVGGGLVRLAVVFVPVVQSSVILSLAIATSIAAIVVASRLNRWYLRTLEGSLLERGGGLDLSDTSTDSVRTVLPIRKRDRPTSPAEEVDPSEPVSIDPEVQQVQWLRSRDPERAVQVLSNDDGLPSGLIPYVIPLLASEPLAHYALFALRKVAEERVGELVDALIDPNQDHVVRRRLARVFSVCVSQRATDGLMLALEDDRFDVRVQAARSLASIYDKNPRVHIDRDRIFQFVMHEVAVGRPVWESRRLLDGFVTRSPLDEFVRDRAGQSLAHVFTLLSLVLPREPLQIAFRSLHAGDRYLRGTALEYLEGVLPPTIRERLWPFLVRPRATRPDREHDEAIVNLLRSSGSVTLQDWAKYAARPPAAGFAAV
jgi:AAA family ATP:ADP antiporter